MRTFFDMKSFYKKKPQKPQNRKKMVRKSPVLND